VRTTEEKGFRSAVQGGTGGVRKKKKKNLQEDQAAERKKDVPLGEVCNRPSKKSCTTVGAFPSRGIDTESAKNQERRANCCPRHSVIDGDERAISYAEGFAANTGVP